LRRANPADRIDRVLPHLLILRLSPRPELADIRLVPNVPLESLPIRDGRVNDARYHRVPIRHLARGDDAGVRRVIAAIVVYPGVAENEHIDRTLADDASIV